MRTIAALAFSVYAAAYAQPPAAPKFEVASVKPTPPDQQNGNSGGKSGNGRYTYTNVTLKRCIMGSFGLGPNQIAGGPSWLDTDRFEIAAKAEQPVNDDVLDRMMQSLLAERFKLAFHKEAKMTKAYVLEVAKNGPKLEVAQGGESTTRHHRGIIDAKATTMAHFAEVLSREMDLPVVNQTGLSGTFNVELKWTPESTQPVKLADAAADTGPTLFTALQHFGLRLTLKTVPVEVLVIDHAERPTEN